MFLNKHYLLKIDLEEAISTAASEIHYSLQYVSPWWTGSFNTAWEIDDQPISPSLKRVISGGGSTLAPGNLGQIYPYPPQTPRKAPTRLGHLTQLGRSIYIGNMMNYAGFVVNKKGEISYHHHGYEKGDEIKLKKHLKTL